ncbi:hypothetical protein GTQ40_15660 [Flavobacteriaceae bacterium R38]|nr:hypothetical protein [Flavobacteriaceae bacterium R38]
MLKDILKLKGVAKLEKKEQTNVNGGFFGGCQVALCLGDEDCGGFCQCIGNICQSNFH